MLVQLRNKIVTTTMTRPTLVKWLTALVLGGLVGTPGVVGQQTPVGAALNRAIVLSRLFAPGTPPFHLKATSGPAHSHNAQLSAEVEVYWVSPQKWRRAVRSKDFEQTVIVNGDVRSEKNSGDYFPKWLNDIVTATLELVPQHSVAEVAKLDGKIDPQRGGSVTFTPTSTDGKTSTFWWGSVTVDSGGLLAWISGTGFAARFSDYERFHNKEIARTVETFPLVDSGDLITEVESLSDLNEVDESLFTVSEPTPKNLRLQTVQMNEVEYRKLAVDPPEMKWAALNRQPTHGVLNTYIVTDTTGKVRECGFIVSSNMALKESALELVKQWRFKPVIVDGMPTQVETTLTFEFDTSMEGDQAKYKAASFYFKTARDLTYPRTDQSPGFHMKGKFVWSNGRATNHGNYEETWQSADHWRRAVTIGNETIVETRLEDDHYEQTGPPDVEALATRALSLYTAEFPGYAYASPDTDWRMDESKLHDLPVLRVSMGPTDDLKEHQYPRAYYFDSNGLVRARSMSNELITYGDFVEWKGKQIPRQIQLNLNDNVVLVAHIDLIEEIASQQDDFFTIPGVKPHDWLRPPVW